MCNSNFPDQWRVIGASVRGASHKKHDLPNQDAIFWALHTEGDLPPIEFEKEGEVAVTPTLIMSVADGHGSAKSFRSDIGAQYAVEVARWYLPLYLGTCDESNLSAIKHLANENIPQALTVRWQEAVRTHYRENPFSRQEIAGLTEKQGSSAVEQVLENPILAYGSTLLSVVIKEIYFLVFQIGDGDILIVSDDGAVSRPFPKDPRLLGNETTSLCDKHSWEDFQVRFQVISGSPPALIILATDGYANSFLDERSFLQVGSDLLNLLRSSGTELVKAELENWLNEASKLGSGDDVTVGMIIRESALEETNSHE